MGSHLLFILSLGAFFQATSFDREMETFLKTDFPSEIIGYFLFYISILKTFHVSHSSQEAIQWKE